MATLQFMSFSELIKTAVNAKSEVTQTKIIVPNKNAFVTRLMSQKTPDHVPFAKLLALSSVDVVFVPKAELLVKHIEGLDSDESQRYSIFIYSFLTEIVLLLERGYCGEGGGEGEEKEAHQPTPFLKPYELNCRMLNSIFSILSSFSNGSLNLVENMSLKAVWSIPVPLFGPPLLPNKTPGNTSIATGLELYAELYLILRIKEDYKDAVESFRRKKLSQGVKVEFRTLQGVLQRWFTSVK